MKLHRNEQRHYFYICDHCNKKSEMVLDVYIESSEDLVALFPQKWGYLHCGGENPIVLCEECYPNFKNIVIEIRNSIIFK